MSVILPHIYWILIGFFGSGLVNGISDWFSVRRSLVSEEFSTHLFAYDYWWGMIAPWRFSASEKYWRVRVYIVHLGMLIGSFVLFYLGLSEVSAWWGFPLLVYLAIVTVMDIEHRLILHPISLFGGIFGFILGSYLHGVIATLLGGFFGFGAMYLMYLLGGWLLHKFKRWQGGEEEEPIPLGFGDVNLSGVMGLLLGWPGVGVGFFVTVVFAGLVGGLYLLAMVVFRRYRSDLAMPYGPFIVFAILTLLYFRSLY